MYPVELTAHGRMLVPSLVRTMTADPSTCVRRLRIWIGDITSHNLQPSRQDRRVPLTIATLFFFPGRTSHPPDRAKGSPGNLP